MKSEKITKTGFNFSRNKNKQILHASYCWKILLNDCFDTSIRTNALTLVMDNSDEVMESHKMLKSSKSTSPEFSTSYFLSKLVFTCVAAFSTSKCVNVNNAGF